MIVEWLIFATVMSALAAGAAWVVERGVVGWGAGSRWVWVAAIGISVGVPVLTALLPRGSTAVAEVDAALVMEPVSEIEVAAVEAARASWMERVGVPVLLGWGGLSLVLLARLPLCWVMLRRRRREWRRTVVDGTEVLLSTGTGPAVVGVRDPAIVLPEWVLDCKDEQRALIVAHEAEHQRAGDTRLLLLGQLAVALVPWNLPLWWQGRRLRLAAEVDCDRRVLERFPYPRRYAELLISVARKVGRSAIPAPAFAERQTDLERRIRVIGARHERRALQAIAALLAILAVPLGVQAVPLPEPLQLRLGVAGGDASRGAPSGGHEDTQRISATAALAGQNVAQEPIYEVATLDRKPELTNKSQVASVMQRLYPAALESAGIGGQVMVQFVIAADGQTEPASIKIIDASREEFADATVKAVERFRFRPGQKDGRHVRTIIQMPITWQPRGVDAEPRRPEDVSAAAEDAVRVRERAADLQQQVEQLLRQRERQMRERAAEVEELTLRLQMSSPLNAAIRSVIEARHPSLLESGRPVGVLYVIATPDGKVLSTHIGEREADLAALVHPATLNSATEAAQIHRVVPRLRSAVWLTVVE